MVLVYIPSPLSGSHKIKRGVDICLPCIRAPDDTNIFLFFSFLSEKQVAACCFEPNARVVLALGFQRRAILLLCVRLHYLHVLDCSIMYQARTRRLLVQDRGAYHSMAYLVLRSEILFSSLCSMIFNCDHS